MNFQAFTGPGSTRTRRSTWDKIRSAVVSAQKKEGKNVSVDVYEGQGSVISVNPQRSGTQQLATGACCTDGDCAIATRADCEAGGGNYLGDNTTCEDVDCTQGACCDGGDCTLTTEEECTGEFQGYGTTCDPNPCGCVEPGCAFEDPLGDGRWFLTATYTQDSRIYGGGGSDHACCRELGGSRTYFACELSACSDRTEFSFDCESYFDHGSGCTFSCVGAYAGCSYLPGSSISGDTITFTYCCDDGCTEGVDCVECGTTTVTYSDEVTPC